MASPSAARPLVTLSVGTARPRHGGRGQQAGLGRRKGHGLRAAFAAVIAFAVLAQQGPALAGYGPGAETTVAAGIASPSGAAAGDHGVPLGALYSAQPPATMGAGTDLQIPVTLTNVGDETWSPFAPPATSPALGQVALSYHWYTATGAVVTWDGLRSHLGPADVARDAKRAVTATVRAPTEAGAYFLRFAVVKEGVAWASPSQMFAVQVNPAYSARFTQPTVHALLLGKSYSFPVTVTNTGSAAWTPSGGNPVNLAYHWHDAKGNTVVWDGTRTPLAADVAPGAPTTMQMKLTAPATAGTYRLTVDLVREGVGWFSQFGGTSAPVVSVVVAPIYFAAQYSVAVSAAAYVGETRTIPVSVTNSGNVPWGGPDVVNLAYHIHDAQGRTVVWDGARTPLGDVAVGASKTVQLTYTAPTAMGDYTLTIDAVREGVAWLGTTGSTPVRLPMKVDSGFGVGYGASTTPQVATIGARVSLRVDVNNYGPRPLISIGPNAVRLSYHIYTASGSVVTWDGLRGQLPGDIPAGASASVPIDVQLPSRVGDYRIKWDLVQEGVAWLSGYGIVQKEESINVQPGVTFYGKGYGHGLGMSQWGAQGMATGAMGAPRTGEQIVTYYYPGTTLTPIPPDSTNKVIRVLLSQPSSVGKYSCGGAVFQNSIANLVSAGGFRVLNEAGGNAEILRAGPGVSVQMHAAGGVVNVWNQATATPTLVYSGPGPVVTVPLDPAIATTFQEKGLYRGNFRFTNLGGTLRVLNVLSYDEYVKGVVPLEMLKDWHLEAYKAQALAARTYAYNSYRGGASDYDVLDDQSDQCYGGVKMRNGRVVETEITNRAVDLTAGILITFNGQAIRAYFSSSSGGYSKPVGCWAFNVKIAADGSVSCNGSPSYLTAVPDPADIAVSVPEPNRQGSWQVTFTSDQVRDAIIRYRGVDIGPLLSVDLSNRVPAVVGHVVSVKVVGQFMTLDLPADRLLRDHLFLKSTMVRLAPW